jgi:transposase-like protein
MEMISGVERHRRWRLEDKLRIVAEAEAPGAVFAFLRGAMRFRGVSSGNGARRFAAVN